MVAPGQCAARPLKQSVRQIERQTRTGVERAAPQRHGARTAAVDQPGPIRIITARQVQQRTGRHDERAAGTCAAGGQTQRAAVHLDHATQIVEVT